MNREAKLNRWDRRLERSLSRMDALRSAATAALGKELLERERSARLHDAAYCKGWGDGFQYALEHLEDTDGHDT